ncbi:amidase [Natronococcus sp. A-GB7]|uniref:amidase n=1 Tax=Natronococcus sp. A-GB7 TaxID=3037649 RepID=UPI00241D805E|nr:amidase [Natronococcus sp. A-GB7]MDG5821392.1 amidase [Natronococcus sp. A-GB7]
MIRDDCLNNNLSVLIGVRHLCRAGSRSYCVAILILEGIFRVHRLRSQISKGALCHRGVYASSKERYDRMLYDEPLAAAADGLRVGRIDLEAYLDELEQRADVIEPKIQSLVSEDGRWKRLRKEAAELSDRYSDSTDRPPLYGIPVGVKDVFHVDGLPTRAGTDVPSEALAGDEAAAVTSLRRAGALVFGKTVTTEFAHFDPGPTRNPHDLERTPGGSSSGSAAAVAAGLCPVALGTQTIGSVIRPAAFCGIVGFKPSYGRISSEGLIPLSKSVDHVGVFTQDTAGIALIAPVLCEGWRSLSASIRKPSIGVPDGPYLEQASDDARNAFESQLDRLQSAGYDVVRLTVFDSIDEINDRHERLVASDAALDHELWYDEYGELYSDETSRLIEDGKKTTAAEIAKSRRSRIELRARLAEAMNQHDLDLWIAPAAPGPAPVGIETTGDPIMNLPWTHAGLPTITVPASRTNEGLPLGVQCAGRFGADEDVVRWSHDIADVFSEQLYAEV